MNALLSRWVRQPAVINAAQIIGYVLAGACGLLAAMNGIPNLITGTIGPILSVAVGSILVVGGIVGAFAVIVGHWWLERIALAISGIGYVLLLVPSIYFALTRANNSTIWLIVALEIIAILDCFKRARRIDWAYLDPTK